MEKAMALVKYPKYEAYKDSGVEWLGDVPKGWETIKMKFLFREVSIKNKPDKELLSVTQSNGVIPRSWVENRMVMPSGNLETFKFIKKGDFAISLRSFEGGLEYCHHDGIISPAYTVLKKKRMLNEEYYKYLFKSGSFISELQTCIVGIREGKNISYPILSYSLLPVPTKTQQTAIAQFLDEKTAKIDRAIAQKEKMIALLKERKQILIQNAVTKGLDPDVPMKDSGVEWIGEIPAHWEVKRLKYVMNLRNEKTLSSNSELPYLGMENVVSKLGKYIDLKSEAEGLANIFFKNDILFGKLRPYLAKVYLAEFNGICSTEFLVFKCDNPQYFSFLLLSDDFIQKVNSSTYGSKMPRASSNFVANIRIPIPPLEEKMEIFSSLKRQISIYDNCITHQKAQIQNLKTYKATLIDSAVTGKIKVT